MGSDIKQRQGNTLGTEDFRHAGADQQNIAALTGLRFFAAFFVLISHALPATVPVPATNPFYLTFHALSGIGMPLFFVLSGFVIQYNYAGYIRKNGTRGIYNFFVARFARLYPLFFLCLAYDLLYQWSFRSLPAETWQALPFYLTLTHSWVYMLFGDTSLPFVFGLMPQVSWSISVEWFFYLLFPLICLLPLKLKTPKASVFAIAVIGLLGAALSYLIIRSTSGFDAFATAHFGPAVSPHTFTRWLTYFSPYLRIFEFTLGCLAAELYLRLAARPVSPQEQKWGGLLLLAALATLLACYLLAFPLSLLIPKSVNAYFNIFRLANGLALPLCVIIFCCARYSNAVTRFLTRKYILLGGEISYSIYMLHFLIIQPFGLKAGKVTFPELYVADFLSLATVIAAVFGLALISYTFIEMPTKRWISRTFSLKPGESAKAYAKAGSAT